MNYLFLLLPSLYFFSNTDTSIPDKNTVTIQINELQEATGQLHIAVFEDEKGFLKTKKAIFLKIVEVSNTSARKLNIDDLDAGDYAIAIYHDVNNNGKLDTNILGIPKEPYAFSNNSGKKWKKPSFDDAKIVIDGNPLTVEFNLKYWKDYWFWNDASSSAFGVLTMLLVYRQVEMLFHLKAKDTDVLYSLK